MKDCKKTVKAVASIFVGLILTFTAFFTYGGHLSYELTFLSNLLTGVFFIAAGILWLLNKPIPQFMFFNFTMLLLIVFGVCMAFVSNFNFEGGFVFLHIVNPLLVLAFYLLFSDQTGTRAKLVLTALVMPLLYLVFALIFGTTTGNYIYFFFDYKEYGVAYTALFIMSILAGFMIIGYLLYFLNQLIHKGPQCDAD